MPSYDLCPAVSVDEIIGEMRAASRELAKLGRPLVVSGHSAGGHLAACMLATDWRAFDASLPEELVTAAYAISGLFDLRPLVRTSINTALKLDDASARAASPLFWKSPSHGTLDAVVGGNESAEYFRQSRTIVDAWGAAGIATRFGDSSRCQPFYRHCAARRSRVADGAAAEATRRGASRANSGGSRI